MSDNEKASSFKGNDGSVDGQTVDPSEHPGTIGSNSYHQEPNRDTILVDPAPYLVQIAEIKDLSSKKGFRIEKLEREVDKKDKDIAKLKRETDEKDKRIALLNLQLGSEHYEGPRDRKEKEKLLKRINELEDENKKLKVNVKKSETENYHLKVRLKSKRLWQYGAGALFVCITILVLISMYIPCKTCPDIIPNKPCPGTDYCTKQINSLTLEITDLENKKKSCEGALSKISSESNTCRIEKKADLETKEKELELEKAKVKDDLKDCRLDQNKKEKKVKELESEINNTKDDSQRCKKEISNSEERIKQLETEIDNTEENYQGCKQEKSNSEEIIKKLEKEINNTKEDSQVFRREISNSEEKIKKLATEKGNTNDDLEICKREKADIEIKLKNRIKLETVNEVNYLEKEMNDSRDRESRLKTEKDQLENEKVDLENKVNKMKDIEDELQREKGKLQKKITKVTDEQKRLNAELEDLQKLSECQTRVPDSLSPPRIGQEFKTLYDKHYTVALDELEAKHGILNVKETVKMFLDILKTAHALTEYYTQRHIHSMKSSTISLEIEVHDKNSPDKQNSTFLNGTFSRSDWKLFYELRQQSAWGMLDALKNELGDKIARKFLVDCEAQPRMITYIEQCISVCWTTHLHREPVHIDFDEPGNTAEFDYKTFKPFMYQSGNYIDYVVWPPVFEKKGGHMIAKGIAERKDTP